MLLKVLREFSYDEDDDADTDGGDCTYKRLKWQ